MGSGSSEETTMRVLVFLALVCASRAAPSAPAEALPLTPLVTPTISPGDLQAAAIDAQVRAEDQARAIADSARELTEEKVIEASDLAKEKSEEVFWAVQDKKWQALDAAQSVGAKVDGAIASNAEALARSALGGVIIPTYLTPQIVPGLTSPVVAPVGVAPIVYASPLAAPALNKEDKKEEKEKELVKTAELDKKDDENKLEEKKEDKLTTPLLTPLVAPPSWVPGVNLAPLPVGVAPVGVAPVFLPQPVLTPVIKTQW